MSKERLEVIKRRYIDYETDFNIHSEDVEWLIEQVQNLESRLAFEQGVTSNLQSKNKRYREALEEIKGATSHNKYWKHIAFKALEGEE